jgi:hypothetical protein
MRFTLLITAILVSLVSFTARSSSDEFIYPQDFAGSHVRAKYDTSAYGYAKNNGYVSIFNLTRKVAESFLPPRFALADIDGNKDVVPLIVVWGRMSDTGAVYAGVNLPYGLSYNEMHFFIPGVYEKSGDPKKLRTYTPRMFVDEAEPEILGRRFFYKKILLEGAMSFNIDTGMQTGDWVTTEVDSSGRPSSALTYQNIQWKAALSFLPYTDIMGEREGEPRCSGFEWVFNEHSTIAPAEVSLQVHRKLTERMDASLLEKKIRSVASFRVENWHFLVDYYYNDCR